MSTGDCYISVDIEADGPYPGTEGFSMLALGMCVAATFDGTTFTAADPDEDPFYAELRPISDRFVASALAVGGLDRDRLLAEGGDPADVMAAAAAWVTSRSGDLRPVLVGYPGCYDFVWTHWYFEHFTGGDPFGFNGCYDMKALYAARTHVTWAEATKRFMPPELHSDRPHTHNALDDAKEQADLFVRLWDWQYQAGS